MSTPNDITKETYVESITAALGAIPVLTAPMVIALAIERQAFGWFRLHKQMSGKTAEEIMAGWASEPLKPIE